MSTSIYEKSSSSNFLLFRDSSSTIFIATISSQVKARDTADLMVCSVHLREVALSQQVRKFEDIVLDLFVDGSIRWRLLLFYHYVYIYIISLNRSKRNTSDFFQLLQTLRNAG